MKLYKYQSRAIRFILAKKAKCGAFLEMGTGKTRVSIEVAVRLRRCRRILVVAPLSAAGGWRREISKWAPEARTLTCIRGTVPTRAAKIKRLRLRGPKRRVFVVVGYESFWREPLRSEILKFEPDMVIYDEAHRLKGRGTRQSRFAHALADDKSKRWVPPYRLALTGTPLPNGPEDAFSLFKAIDPSVFGTRWLDFEAEYIRRGGFNNYQIVGYKNIEQFTKKIDEHSFRITKQEAFDLPEQVDVIVPVPLSKKARKVYDALSRDAIAEIETATGKGIALGRIVLTNILRLQQVASGFVKVEDGRTLQLATDKQDTLSDLLRDALAAAGRVVVFCRFRADVEAAIDVARGLVGDATYRIDGTVDVRDREAQLRWFRAFEPAVLVGQIQVAATAIDLTCAHVGIFYSRDYSLLNYDQARSRLHRHGQKEKVTYYHLVAENTIDEKILSALQHKDNLQRKLLDGRRARRFFS